MSTTEQPEAIKLAKWLETIDDESWNSCWHSHTPQKAAAELRRLHAENAEVRAGYDAARLEIASLQAQLEAVGAGGVGPLVGAPAQPQDGVAFELWRTDHMPDAAQEAALAEWRTLHSSQAAQPAAQAQEDAKCEWLLTDDGSERWDSDCGEAWLFTDGGPAENSVRFCHGCGKQVAIAAQEDTKDAS